MSENHRSAVAAFTESAMAGEVPLEEVYGRRLELIRPSAADDDYKDTPQGHKFVVIKGRMETL